MNQQTESGACPRCGMSIADGSNPTTRDGVTYCCEGCANGTQCTCPGHRHEG